MLPVVGWIVIGLPLSMASSSIGSGLRAHVELGLPLAGQKNVPNGAKILLLPLPGRMSGSVFQVMLVSLQVLLLSKSNSNMPAAILLKLPLLGCWPAVATLEKSDRETDVTTQLPAPNVESNPARNPDASKRSSVSSVRGWAAVGAASSIAPRVPKFASGWPDETKVSASAG